MIILENLKHTGTPRAIDTGPFFIVLNFTLELISGRYLLG